mgnify:CR=1 FL=1
MSVYVKYFEKTLAFLKRFKYNINTNRTEASENIVNVFKRCGLLNLDIAPSGLYIKKFFYRRSLQ